jgi:hypothetical protein
MNNQFQDHDKQIEKFHYQKKNQIAFTSLFNSAIDFVKIELEQGYIKQEEWEQRFNVWYDRLMKLFVEKEKQFLNDYFALRKEVAIKDENIKNE